MLYQNLIQYILFIHHTCLYAVCSISKLYDVKLLLGDALHYPTGGLFLSMCGYNGLTNQDITISCIPGYASMSVLYKVLHSSVFQITYQAPNTLLSLTHTAMAHLDQGNSKNSKPGHQHFILQTSAMTFCIICCHLWPL